ncbi:unnamed protein product [Calicophoron daubneyi]|uniref:Centrosomal protein of 19 kDa n=1 Tax=Calicophoron daubneyi TaxID=300641 RepID=A0AAV2T507_CALDB
MDTNGVSVTKCGIKRNPPSLVVIYHKGLKTRKRTIKLHRIDENSTCDVYSYLCNDELHGQFAKLIPKAQLLRMLAILKDIVKGVPLAESIRRSEEVESILPTEDLNVVDVDVLERKKAIMDKLFDQNRIPSDDPNFQYDKEVDFAEDKVETCTWDSDECEI